MVFTDGSWEDGHAGLGAVVLDTADGSAWVWSGQVPEALLDKWRGLVGDTYLSNRVVCHGGLEVVSFAPLSEQANFVVGRQRCGPICLDKGCQPELGDETIGSFVLPV